MYEGAKGDASPFTLSLLSVSLFSRGNKVVAEVQADQSVCLLSLGTKGTFYPPTTPSNNVPIPQVMKQVVNLSCSFYYLISDDIFNRTANHFF